MTLHFLLAFLGMVITAFSQLLFKMGSHANRNGGILDVYLNRYSIPAYGLLLLVTLLNLFAFGKLDMRYALLIQPFTLVLVCLFSVFFLHEHMKRRQQVGTIVIVLGVLVYNI